MIEIAMTNGKMTLKSFAEAHGLSELAATTRLQRAVKSGNDASGSGRGIGRFIITNSPITVSERMIRLILRRKEMKDQKQEGGDHYRNLDVQPWEALESWMTKEQFHGFLLGSAVAYLARFNVKVAGKGGITDIKKARHYLEALEECLTKTK